MKIEKFLILIVIVILFGQSILSSISALSNVALILLAIMQFRKVPADDKMFIFRFTTFVLLLVSYSMVLDNEIKYALRFAIILILLVSSYVWKVNSRYFLKILVIVSSILILALIAFEIYLFLYPELISFIRNEIVIAREMGDVFPYNDIYYKLELRGTSLIAFVYMLSYVVDIFPKKYDKLLKIYYLLGAILAGNFAYQLAIIIFHIFYYVYTSSKTRKQMVRRICVLGICSIFAGGILYSFISNTMEEKSDFSNVARYDQVEVLYNDITEYPHTYLFGSGLGHTLNVITKIRDYRGAVYFEVQPMYFLNQLGIVFFVGLILLNLHLTFKYIRNKKLIFVYMMYVMYASTNPYILDTTQIVVIMSLTSALQVIKENRRNNSIYGKNNLHLSPIQA